MIIYITIAFIIGLIVGGYLMFEVIISIIKDEPDSKEHHYLR